MSAYRAADAGVAVRIKDLGEGVTGVGLTGSLTLATVPGVRDALLKVFADTPAAVVADLSELLVGRPALLAVFPAAVRQQAPPAIELLLACPSPWVRTVLRNGVGRRLRVFAHVAEARRAALPAPVACRRTVHLPATEDAARAARRAVAQACADWELQHVSDSAVAVASELVANGVMHARTPLRLSLALRGEYLFVAVQDGDPRHLPPPRTAEGPGGVQPRAGLFLVDLHTVARGVSVLSDGKQVWTSIRAWPIGAQGESRDAPA